VDIEFTAQFLQIVHAADGGPLEPNTAQALEAFGATGLAPAESLEALVAAWGLQQDLTQLLKVALEEGADPAAEPRAFQAILARAGGVKTLKALKVRLAAAQGAARRAYEQVVR
jgi:glutamate-ammonia-ligase adenylyltransferase